MDVLVATLSGVSLSVIGLCALRSWRSKSWGCVSRMSHLRDKKLDGQVIVVTGGNAGLGYKAAEDFARRGAAAVILACRNLSKGAEAASKIRDQTGNSNVECLKLDLASMENVRTFSKQLLERYPRIDCLVCNAGVWFPMSQCEKTADNLEVHVGVNHIGHFLLTDLLIDHVDRVVIVSSGLMLRGQIDIDDSRQFLEGRRPKEGEKMPKFAPAGYCDSKLMNAVFARELAVRQENKTVICIGPGWCKTELPRNVEVSWIKKALFAPVALLFMRSSEQGAQNIIYAVLEDGGNIQSGYFYRDFKPAAKENEKVDNFMSLSTALWTRSEEITRQPCN